jgi:uncharacterized membrane protein
LATTEVQIIASFLLAFKAILVEGSEVAILSLAIIKQVGRRNVFFGVAIGALASVVTFLVVRQIFLLFQEYIIELATGVVILYFSYRFLRGFVRYYFRGKSFRAKMEKWSSEVIAKDMKHSSSSGERPVASHSPATTTPSSSQAPLPFSIANSVPIISITVTEGFEASLVLAAAGAFDLEFTIVGALLSILLLVVVSAISYEYLMRVPRWLLDLVAGGVLLSFGTFFLITGILTGLHIIS